MSEGCPSNETIDDFVRGALAAGEIERLEQHFDACDQCRDVVGLLASRDTSHTGNEAWVPLVAKATLGRYEIREQLGAGAMGVVYRAWDPQLQREVAVKVLPAGQELVVAEARALAALEHPHIVTIYEVAEADGIGFLAMEYVRGTTLDADRRQHEHDWRFVAARFTEIIDALAVAHRSGRIHGDVKPANVLVSDGGIAKLTDLGLSRRLEQPSADVAELVAAVVDAETTTKTADGGVGTPAYMAPEVFAGQPPSPKSDQFSLCATFFEALYGQRAFAGDTLAELAEASRHAAEAAPPADTPVPSRVHAVLLRGLQDDPDERYGDLDTLRTDLDDAISPPRPRNMWLGAGVVAVALMVGAIVVTQRSTAPAPCSSPELTDVWTLSARRAVADHFSASGKPYAEQVWLGVRGQLDNYSAKFAESRTRACAASDPSARACLARGHSSFTELVARLRTLERDRIQQIPDVASILPNLEHCADQSAPSPRTDPLLEDQLARTQVLGGLGDHAQAADQATKVRDRAEELGLGSVQARAEIALAYAARGNRRPLDEMREHAERALNLAQAASDDASVAEAAFLLLSAAELDLDEANRWAKFARASLARSGGDPLVSAKIEQAQAAALKQAGKLEASIPAYRRALRLFEEELGPGLLVMSASHGLAAALSMQGNFDEALSVLDKAQDAGSDRLGHHHPMVGTLAAMRGQVLMYAGRFDDAVLALQEAERIQIANGGRDSPAALFSQQSIADVRFEQGRLQEAMDLYGDIFVRIRVVTGPQSRQVRHIATNMAELAYLLGQPEDAIEYVATAVAAAQRAGDDTPNMVEARALAAKLRCTQGDGLDELEALAEQISSVELPRKIAAVRFHLAECLLLLNRPRQAISTVDEHCLDEQTSSIRPRGGDCLIASEAWAAAGDRATARDRWDRAKRDFAGYGFGERLLELRPRP